MDDFISWDLMREHSAPLLGRPLNDVAISRFNRYAECLVEATKSVNLTRIIEPDEIVIKHFIDSIALFKYCKLEDGMEVCDVGTGAGFPGLALLIANPRIKLTLMDSTNKKLEFVRFMVKELMLKADVVTARAEDAGKSKLYRERFDLVTARAVAQLNVIDEYCLPLLKVGGEFAPLKGRLSDEEKENGIRAAKTLGAEMHKDCKYNLPDGSERELVIFRKKAATIAKYPRNGAQISKKPL